MDTTKHCQFLAVFGLSHRVFQFLLGLDFGFGHPECSNVTRDDIDVRERLVAPFSNAL